MFANMSINAKKDKGVSLVSYVQEPAVPDWVGAPTVQLVQEPIKSTPELDILADYAKTIKPVDDSIHISEDKSNVIKQTDDFLAQYGRNLPPEKKIVGAVTVDDEYKEGPVRLIVRNKVNKDLDEIFGV
jgi:hypothetical protein